MGKLSANSANILGKLWPVFKEVLKQKMILFITKKKILAWFLPKIGIFFQFRAIFSSPSLLLLFWTFSSFAQNEFELFSLLDRGTKVRFFSRSSWLEPIPIFWWQIFLLASLGKTITARKWNGKQLSGVSLSLPARNFCLNNFRRKTL